VLFPHAIAKAQYGASGQGLEWAAATMTQFYMGKVNTVLGGLRRMPPTADETVQVMANGWDYLNAHRGRTHYRHFRCRGSPLGSGALHRPTNASVMSG
jgi:hypothetical protein